MACFKNCPDCEPTCGDEPSQPVASRCADIALTPGVHTNATVTVNEAGCLVAVQTGAAPLYTPDPCCGTAGGGGGGGQGLPGPKGDPGTAATITLGTVSTGAPGTPVQITNTGSNSAAVFNFRIPRGADGESGSVPSGADLNGPGLVFADGILTDVTPSWPPVYAVITSATPTGFVLTASKNSTTGELELELDATAYDTTLRAALQGQFDAQQAQIENLQTLLSNLQVTVAALGLRVDGIDTEIADITDRLDDCCPPAP